jgi:ribosomal protein L11 methyltransferase
LTRLIRTAADAQELGALRIEELADGDWVASRGTGTGILAIAVAKVLASRVVATDADAKAVSVAATNAKKNGVAPRFRVVRPRGSPIPRCGG